MDIVTEPNWPALIGIIVFPLLIMYMGYRTTHFCIFARTGFFSILSGLVTFALGVIAMYFALKSETMAVALAYLL